MKQVFIDSGYDSLRGVCEVVVEQTMLQAVVQSYSPNIMVGKLTDINFDALRETATEMKELFDKCCRYVDSHRQPLETLNVRPKLQELEDDWKRLQAIRTKCSP